MTPAQIKAAELKAQKAAELKAAQDAEAPAQIDPKIMAIYNSTVGILGSKLVIDSHLGRQVELSIIGNGVFLERGAYLYNTNVTTEARLISAIEMLDPEEFFNNVGSEEDALVETRKALNIASVSFSVQAGRGEKLTHGELIVAQVQEYDSKATGKMELGLKFIRKAQAVVMTKSSNGALAKLKAFASAANDPFED